MTLTSQGRGVAAPTSRRQNQPPPPFFLTLGWRIKQIKKAWAEMQKKDEEIRGLLDEIRRISISNNFDEWEEHLENNKIILTKNPDGRYTVRIEG